MTATTREIFEKYEVRKTKKQKSAFIDYVRGVAEGAGCRVTVEKKGRARNIVIGDVSQAKVVFAAHYDTCPVLPFPNFITPKCVAIYVLYQIALVAAFLLVAFAIGFAAGLLTAALDLPAAVASTAGSLCYWVLLVLLLAGPANKHTANDNTSGVTAVLDIMLAMPEAERAKAAFVLFDLEEVGLIGSSAFAKAHKNEMKDKLLVNFDCVSDGEDIIFALRKGAKAHAAALEAAFAPNGTYRVEVAAKGIFYPSDQMNFPCGVGVAALRRTRKGLLYMNRIHTKRDTVYNEANIAFLKDGALRLTERL